MKTLQLAVLAVAFATTYATCPTPKVMESLDAANFSTTWYENRNDCQLWQDAYKICRSDRFTVAGEGFSYESKYKKRSCLLWCDRTQSGTAAYADTTKKDGSLTISRSWMLPRRWRVLDTDYDTYALVSECDLIRGTVRLFTKDKKPTDAVITAALALIKTNTDVNTDSLRCTGKQDNC